MARLQTHEDLVVNRVRAITPQIVLIQQLIGSN